MKVVGREGKGENFPFHDFQRVPADDMLGHADRKRVIKQFNGDMLRLQLSLYSFNVRLEYNPPSIHSQPTSTVRKQPFIEGDSKRMVFSVSIAGV